MYKMRFSDWAIMAVVFMTIGVGVFIRLGIIRVYSVADPTAHADFNLWDLLTSDKEGASWLGQLIGVKLVVEMPKFWNMGVLRK